MNRRRIFLLGHGEGGLLAAYYAAKRKRDLRGMVLVSTPGVPYRDYILDQWKRRWLTVGMKVPVVRIPMILRMITTISAPKGMVNSRR